MLKDYCKLNAATGVAQELKTDKKTRLIMNAFLVKI